MSKKEAHIRILWTIAVTLFACITALFASLWPWTPFEGRLSIDLLLVTAHPDDEAMFFTPSIRYARSISGYVKIFCLSNGSYASDGFRRTLELARACEVLDLRRDGDSCIVNDFRELKDDPFQIWDKNIVFRRVSQYVHSLSEPPDTLMTFDRIGVSGHMNHVGTHLGIEKFLAQKFSGELPNVKHILLLKSPRALEKFAGPFAKYKCIFNSFFFNHSNHICFTGHMSDSWNAMIEHESQWTWFRKFFVIFSSMSYVNIFQDNHDTSEILF